MFDIIGGSFHQMSRNFLRLVDNLVRRLDDGGTTDRQ